MANPVVSPLVSVALFGLSASNYEFVMLSVKTMHRQLFASMQRDMRTVYLDVMIFTHLCTKPQSPQIRSQLRITQ
jgi:hypothetical protein